MKDKLARLEGALQAEIAAAKRSLELLRSQKQAIIKNDLEEINRLSKDENAAVEKVEELGFRRQDLVLTASKSGGGIRVTENLRDFLAQLPEGTASALKDLREELRTLYRAVSTEARLNGELLAQSMKVTQHLFDRFSSVDSRLRKGNVNYGRRGYAKARGGAPAVLKEQG